jgi:LysR family hydrogen peroxide-inducible transcriptional activator
LRSVKIIIPHEPIGKIDMLGIDRRLPPPAAPFARAARAVADSVSPMTPLPTIRQMQYFAALAEHRSFSRAAEICNVSQSSLSAAIRALEDAVEAQLVDRSGRVLTLTEAGDAVLARIRTILTDTQELGAIARCDRVPLAGKLRLGVIPSIAPFLLPRALPSLRGRYPELRLYLREGITRVLIEDLKDGRLDVVLIAFPYQLDGVETEMIGRDPFLFAAPREHPLASRSMVRPHELASEPLLLLEDGHCLRQHVLSVAGSAPPGAAEVRATSLTTLVQMADNRLGPTLLPRIAVDAGITAGTDLAIVPVDGARASRDLGLAWRRRSRRAGDFRLIAAHLRGFIRGRHGDGGRAGPAGEAPPPALPQADGARLARRPVPACVLPIATPLPSLSRA